MNILINNAELVIIKNTATVEQAVAWADILCPSDDFTVVGDDHKHYAGYTDFELRIILEKLTGKQHTATTARGLTIDAIIKGAEELEVDNSDLAELNSQAKPIIAKATIAKESKKEISDKPVSGVNRPKAGTVTGRIWDIIDGIIPALKENGIPERAYVIQLCEIEGISASTAATQFSKYKRYLNQ